MVATASFLGLPLCKVKGGAFPDRGNTGSHSTVYLQNNSNSLFPTLSVRFNTLFVPSYPPKLQNSSQGCTRGNFFNSIERRIKASSSHWFPLNFNSVQDKEEDCYCPEDDYLGPFASNFSLVDHLVAVGACSSARVVKAMKDIDRRLFAPDTRNAYVNRPQAIGFNATISAPFMHAYCLQQLEEVLQPGNNVLDIGSGTGYLTACMAMLVGPTGVVVGLEHIPDLVENAKRDVKRSKASSLLRCGSLKFKCGDGRFGWMEDAPYDAIHIGAAVSQVPATLLRQLKPGGRLVAPVGDYFQDLLVVDKHADGSISHVPTIAVEYIPLTDKNTQMRRNLFTRRQ